ncbi:MAG: hypothetical protein AB7I68_01025 [Porticoccaceae bacterium]
MNTSLKLFAAVVVLALTATPALADNDRHNGRGWDHGRTHYRGGDHGGHGYRHHDGYRPRAERHYYHRYHDSHPGHHYRSTHHYYYRDHHGHHRHHGHHGHHGDHDWLAIIGGAILVNEILDH